MFKKTKKRGKRLHNNVRKTNCWKKMEKTPFLALKLISFPTSYDVAISGNPISNYFFAWVSIRRTDIPSPMNQYRTERIMENDLFGTSTIRPWIVNVTIMIKIIRITDKSISNNGESNTGKTDNQAVVQCMQTLNSFQWLWTVKMLL